MRTGFPSGFLWGGALSACQTEGGWREGGKGVSVADILTKGDKETPRRCRPGLDGDCEYPAHRGVEFYHRYRQDIALLAEAGFHALRLSVAWTRLFPTGEETEPNRAGLAFYRDVFETCRAYGMEPIVTICHYDMPLALSLKYGGWRAREVVGHYVRYAKALLDAFSGLVHYWIPFNEINCLTLPLGSVFGGGMVKDGDGILPERDDPSARVQCLHHQFLAAAETAAYAHALDPALKIGTMTAHYCTYPHSCRPEDVALAQRRYQIHNLFCLDVGLRGEYPGYMERYFAEQDISIQTRVGDAALIRRGTADFCGISYYFSTCIGSEPRLERAMGNLMEGARNPYLEESEWGWQIDPEGLRISLNELYGRYRVPLMVLENGLGAQDRPAAGQIHDSYRIDYLRRHIAALREAVRDGVDLRAYTIWGCIDLVSVSTGEMAKRYGIVYVDWDDEGHGTGRRIKKDSFLWYKKVIESNGEVL